MNTQDAALAGAPSTGRRQFLAFALTSTVCASGWAQGDAWPNRPLRIIVSWPPGGSADTTARLVADRLARRLGQPVIVENRPGAGGKIGTQAVARAEPDGYTLLLGAPSEITIAPATTRSLAYDPVKDLQPISTLVSGAYMIVASPRFAPNTVAELVAHAKHSATPINYASYGNNTTNHLYGEQFNHLTGITAAHVAYKGGAPAWTDLMTGQVQFMFENAALAMPLVKAGRMKALAMLTPERIALAPEVPTMTEAGYPGMGMKSWLGLFAPAGTPRPIVNRLHTEVAAVLASPDVIRQFEERGAPASSSTPDEFQKLVRNEIDTWRGLVTKLGLKLD
ncbi:tripartite tricarboxylate transporter substrate binding protein [Hydrogenophaga sp. 2FB]|uniref:Bug family tripartite tricarboxylate transporter substrate binding protein n=1 Tax=Hydrogenophaga sp. 2FB TaxID=2502187 RepID=UPI0010F4DE77|nr:tripartite tricarboxylate transporter substrate binding protein [Hydrogenophaga sp. 2FB]